MAAFLAAFAKLIPLLHGVFSLIKDLLQSIERKKERDIGASLEKSKINEAELQWLDEEIKLNQEQEKAAIDARSKPSSSRMRDGTY